MRRLCPNCSAQSIRVSEVLFDNVSCGNCEAVVGVHRTASWLAGLVIASATTITTLMVLAQSGFFAAMFWLPFPIGSLSYVKARLAPLQVQESKQRT